MTEIDRTLECSLEDLKQINQINGNYILDKKIISRVNQTPPITPSIYDAYEIKLELRFYGDVTDIYELNEPVILFNRGVFYKIDRATIEQPYNYSVDNNPKKVQYTIVVISCNAEFYDKLKVNGQTINSFEYDNKHIQNIIKTSRNEEEFKEKMVVYKI